jgi:hypothetical protein
MAKQTEKQTPASGEKLAKAVTDMANEQAQPVKNDPSASRQQVPPGPASSGAEGYKEVSGLPDNTPAANDPAASRNQIPPGQAQVTMDYNQDPKTVVSIAEQVNQKTVYRDPTDAEIESYIERRYPGKLELIIGNKDKELERLERMHGAGFITAYKDGNKADPRYFSQITWKELGGNSNKEGWRQEIVIPPEVQNLKK